MANLDDVVTVQKNGVVAINALTDALAAFKAIYESFVGTDTFLGISESSLLSQGSGRLVNIVVAVAGSAAGTAHDAASVLDAATDNVIMVIPATVGIYQVNVPFSSGLVIQPGTGQTISVTYS